MSRTWFAVCGHCRKAKFLQHECPDCQAAICDVCNMLPVCIAGKDLEPMETLEERLERRAALAESWMGGDE